jgi:hypothetical protein
MKKEFKIIPPNMPNFVRFENAPVEREQGFKSDEGFDIVNFTEKEALEFAQLMHNEFYDHWQKRKAAQDKGVKP